MAILSNARQLLALVLAIESVRLEIRGLDMVADVEAAKKSREAADKAATDALELVRALAEAEEAELRQGRTAEMKGSQT